MRIIFLDIDGVLNSDRTRVRTPGGILGISDILCARLRIIIETAGNPDDKAKTVLTSSWKTLDPAGDDYRYMMSKLKKAKAEPIGSTKEPGNSSLKRDQGIISYLSEHKDIEQYVILDDYMFDMRDDLARHLVLTDETVGLIDSDVKTAIDILSGNLLPTGYYKDVDKERGYYR